MKLTTAQRAALKALCGRRKRAELKPLFALIRAHGDRALLAAVAPPKKGKAKRGDPLAQELTLAMRLMLAPAAEKAEMLVEHMAKKHRRKLGFAPTGLADAARRLRPHFTDAQIRAGAKGLMRELERLYSARESVV